MQRLHVGLCAIFFLPSIGVYVARRASCERRRQRGHRRTYVRDGLHTSVFMNNGMTDGP